MLPPSLSSFHEYETATLGFTVVALAGWFMAVVRWFGGVVAWEAMGIQASRRCDLASGCVGMRPPWDGIEVAPVDGRAPGVVPGVAPGVVPAALCVFAPWRDIPPEAPKGQPVAFTPRRHDAKKPGTGASPRASFPQRRDGVATFPLPASRPPPPARTHPARARHPKWPADAAPWHFRGRTRATGRRANMAKALDLDPKTL